MGVNTQAPARPAVPTPANPGGNPVSIGGRPQVGGAVPTPSPTGIIAPALNLMAGAPALVSGLPVGSAPPLAAALLDPDTANVLVSGILDRITTDDMKTLMAQLKDSAKRLDSINTEKLIKYAEKAAKAVEEAKKQREQKITGDVGFGLSMAGAVLGMIGAVLLTVVTLGGGGFAIAGAAIGLATAIMDGADRIAKDNNLMDSGINAGKKMDITLGGLVARMAQEITANLPGFDKLPPDQKEKVLNTLKLVCEIIVMVGVAAGTIACGAISMHQIGGAAAKAGTEGAKVAAEAAKFTAQQGAKLASQGAETIVVITEITSSINSIVSGAYGVQMANITFEKNQIDNQRQKFESFAEMIKSEIDANQDALTQRAESLSNIYKNLATTNKNYYESSSRLTNMT